MIAEFASIGRRAAPAFASAVIALGTAACSGGGSSGPSATPAPAIASAPPSSPQLATQLVLPSGFAASIVANVARARELAALPNGDLLVGTGGTSIAIVPAADGPGAPGAARVFASLAEGPAQGLAFASGAIYAASETTIWKLPYAAGDRTASSVRAIARVRTGSVAPHSDGDVHVSTSLAVSGTTLYAGVGSSCNACVETDATRASVQQMSTDGAGMMRLATRSRNPIALAIDPASGQLWIGGAGQDGLPYGHPYEYLDSPTLRGTHDVDYGWPECEENRVPYDALHLPSPPDCSHTVAPAIVFPAYATLVGAAFYPANQSGPYAFPAAYRGGAFVTAHGSWHCCPATPPRVFFVPMHGDTPATPVDWNVPSRQSVEFARGFGTDASNAYVGRPTGVAIGSNGSLFVADDATGNVYRIRPH